MSSSPTGRSTPERHRPTDEQRLASLQSEFGVSPPGSLRGDGSDDDIMQPLPQRPSTTLLQVQDALRDALPESPDMIRARHDALAAKIRLDQISERRPRCVSQSSAAMDDSSHSCAQVSMDESRTRFDKVQEEEPESWEGAARIYEYGSAANPELPKVPVVVHPASLHESGATRVIPFDLSELLGGEGPCTSPNLMASYVRIVTGESITTQAKATSQAYYVIRGSGSTTSEHGVVKWATGDLFVVPKTDGSLQHSCSSAEAHAGAALYWIHDQPLLDYLGVRPDEVKFPPALFTRSKLLETVEEIRHGPGMEHANRLGVLLGNASTEKTTKTLTHVMWSLLNSIGPHTVQKPHRHNSVALDMAVAAPWPHGKVYTLMGRELDAQGNVVDPIRVDWADGSVFVTPPGWWHSHHNESDSTAWVLPIQDAGLYTHQRTLDIRFADDEIELHRQGRIRGTAFNITNKQYLEVVSTHQAALDAADNDVPNFNYGL